MLMQLVFVTICSIGLIFECAAFGQNYPNKPIRLITGDVGGSLDFSARLIAQDLTKVLGQQVIVDNRGGGGSAVAGQTVAKATPDGYTLLFYSSTFWLLPLMRDLPYDPVKDFAPITSALMTPGLLVVHPSVAANSVKDLIALAKLKPGALNYASAGSGSSSHLAMELFKAMAGVNIVHVPYKGGGPAGVDLMSGRVQIMIQSAPAVIPFVKTGRLKALAVGSLGPSALFPEIPAVAATLPGYEAVLRTGLFAPVTTSAAIIDRLGQETVRILNRVEVKAQFFNAGAEVIGGSPNQLASAIKTEITSMSQVIKNAGIKAD